MEPLTFTPFWSVVAVISIVIVAIAIIIGILSILFYSIDEMIKNYKQKLRGEMKEELEAYIRIRTMQFIRNENKKAP